MKWLKLFMTKLPLKLVIGAILDFLDELAKKTDTKIDNEAVKLIRIILEECNLI